MGIRTMSEDTLRHIKRVDALCDEFAIKLLRRGNVHDASKLEEPEASCFAEVKAKLADLEYGSPEYEASKKELKPALEHHYANNRHHPENHKNGIDDMNLLDLVEMFLDWKAAGERQLNGNLKKSIEANASRFNLSSQLVRIFENSVGLFEEE